MRKKVCVFYTEIDFQLDNESYQTLLDFLPLQMRQVNSKYLTWKVRQLNLFGKVLLMIGLNEYGYSYKELSRIKYNQYKCPYFDNIFNFSISHSEDYVICAISNKYRLGVDIEFLRSVDIFGYYPFMTEFELKILNDSENSILDFFSLWTIKESIAKATRSGLSLRQNNFKIAGDEVLYKDSLWFVKSLLIDPYYKTHLASNVRIDDDDISLRRIDLYSNRFYKFF